jgi:hypothetical protein
MIDQPDEYYSTPLGKDEKGCNIYPPCLTEEDWGKQASELWDVLPDWPQPDYQRPRVWIAPNKKVVK